MQTAWMFLAIESLGLAVDHHESGRRTVRQIFLDTP
jgi:hypothetical protein